MPAAVQSPKALMARYCDSGSRAIICVDRDGFERRISPDSIGNHDAIWLIPGSFRNYSLASYLHRESPGKVHLFSPVYVNSILIKEDGAQCPLLLNTPIPASLGGARPFSRSDEVLGEVAEMVASSADFHLDKLGNIMHKHPLWPRISFLNGVCPSSLLLWMSAVVDPRFHINPARPSRKSRFFRDVGIVPSIVESVMLDHAGQGREESEETDEPSGAYELCALLLSGFFEQLPPVFHDRGLGSGDEAARTWFGEKNRGCDDLTATLRSLKRMAGYVFDNWLDCVVPKVQRDPLFDPRLFFRSEDESAAFVRHINKAR